MARRLEVIYSTCVTVERALMAQNAEQDQDMARCLMWHVTEPLSVQAEALQAMAGRLQRASASQPVRP